MFLCVDTGTWHSVEDPLTRTVIGLQEAAVHRPVQVGDEGGGAAALANLLVALSDGIYINQSIVGSHSQESTIWRELELMDHLLSVLDVDHLCHVPAEEDLTLSSLLE